MIFRYTNEIDVDFVRKSIKAIGRCAIKIESASEKCVDVLMELIKNKSHVNYIVQESIIVVKVKNPLSLLILFLGYIPKVST